MASIHILAIGRMSKNHTSLCVAPNTPETATQLNAYLEESLCKPGLDDYTSTAPHDPTFTPNRQGLEEYAAAEADDYEDYLEDIDWLQRNC